MSWIASHIAERGHDACWVFYPMPIVKASLNFAGKFWWALVRSWIQLSYGDNTLMADHIVLVASIIDGYDIDFAWCIVEEIQERALRRCTSISFLCHDDKCLEDS